MKIVYIAMFNYTLFNVKANEKKCQVGVTERNEIKMKKKFSLVVVVANFVNNA